MNKGIFGSINELKYGQYIKQDLKNDINKFIDINTDARFYDEFRKVLTEISKLYTYNKKIDCLYKHEFVKVLCRTIDFGNNELVVVPNKIKYIYNQTYDNYELIKFVREKIQMCKKMNWHKYCDICVMYFCVITLDDPDEKNRILCHIGYTYDLITKLYNLEHKYECNFYLLDMKTICSGRDEKNFHLDLKKKYPELVVNMKIGSHNKDEVYVFDKDLYATFSMYGDMVKFDDKTIKLEKDVNDMINEYF